MKAILTTILVLASIMLYAQDQSYISEIEIFQEELNKEFQNPEKSPLSKKERKKFNGHDFFPINPSFCIEAKFIRTPNSVPFQMKTTTDRAPTYEKYGEAIFEIKGIEYKLSIYQSHRLRQTDKYKDYLFLPFTDLTTGEETYGGGRYVDLSIPNSDIIIIDFNKAYNPYCAYNSNRSCPIPPKENELYLRVEAGVQGLN